MDLDERNKIYIASQIIYLVSTALITLACIIFCGILFLI